MSVLAGRVLVAQPAADTLGRLESIARTIRAVIGAEADVKITVAGQSVTLADGQRIDAATDVRVEAPRASVQSARADVARGGGDHSYHPVAVAQRGGTIVTTFPPTRKSGMTIRDPISR